MGFADIGPYGVKDTKTPNLDRLAKDGVKFFNSYSNGPVCTPTRCGLMTGRYQQRYGLEWAILPTQKEAGLPANESTLPRMLVNAGYKTGIFGKWHLGADPKFGPNAHGFEEFFGILGGNVDLYTHDNINGAHDLWEGVESVRRKAISPNSHRPRRQIRRRAREGPVLPLRPVQLGPLAVPAAGPPRQADAGDVDGRLPCRLREDGGEYRQERR